MEEGSSDIERVDSIGDANPEIGARDKPPDNVMFGNDGGTTRNSGVSDGLSGVAMVVETG